MRELRFAALRGIRTTIQALAGVSASIPILVSVEDARLAGTVAMWGAVGAAVAGVTSFLQNYGEALNDSEVPPTIEIH